MAKESVVVENNPAAPELVWSVAQANCLVVAFHTSFSLEAEQETRPAPVMVEAMLREVVVAFDVVAFRAVKSWSVVEAKVMSPPQNCEAVVEVATR